MEAVPPAGGGGGAVADGVAPHVAAGPAAAAPVALAAEELGPAVEEEEEGGQLADDDHDDAEFAVEEEEEEGGQIDDDDHVDAEVAVEGDDEDEAAPPEDQPPQHEPGPGVEELLGGVDDDDDLEPLVPAAVNQNQPQIQGGQPQELGPFALAPQQNQPIGGGDGDNSGEQVELQEEEEEEIAAPVPLVPAPAAASTQIDYLGFILAGVTMLVLGSVLVAELGTDVTTWMSTVQMMTPKRWTLGVFVAMGDISSLVLTYAPAWKFWAIWRREEGAGVGAGLATMLPLVAAFLNGGVWVFYGAVVAGQNWSVIILNGVGTVFQVLYVTVFCGRSEAPRRHKLMVLMLGAGAGVVIAVVDYFLLHLALGFEMDSAIGWTGAATSITTYAFTCVVNLLAAACNRGAHGVPAQAWTSLTNASIWSVCGAVAQDRRLLVPNLVGILGFIVQACQIVYLRCQIVEEDEDELQRRLLDSNV